MIHPVRLVTIQKIAKGKGLLFEYAETDDCYVALDKVTREVMMLYSPITVALISSDKVWREEFNKLKSQMFR